MNILESYAQVIAETTHSIIGFDTLITDDRGTIIGSNHPDRTGKMHAHSIVVIRRGMAESIDDQKAAELGVRPGVCLPIRLGNEIVGTVGIAGSPDEVRKYGHLVQKEAELFLREKALQETSHLRESAVSNLMNQAISFDPKDMNETVLLSQGKGLGYDLSIPRIVLLVDIVQFGRVVDSVRSEEEYAHDAELRIQTIKSYILKLLRNIFNESQDIVSNTGSDKYLVLMTIPGPANAAATKKQVLEKAVAAAATLREKGYSASIGIGFPAFAPEEFKRSFRSAWRAVNIGRKIRQDTTIFDIGDFELEDLLLSLNKEAAKEYAEKNLSKLFDAPQWSPELEETLREWLRSPSGPGEVARRLGVHRNTLSYRLEKIGELGSFDPKDPSDIFTLKISLLLRDLHIEQHQQRE
jgi:carbohydrate diacid regulator